MISPVKNNISVPIDMGKAKEASLEQQSGNIPDTNNINTYSTGKPLRFVSYSTHSKEFFEPLVRFVDKLVTQESEIYKNISEKDTQDENNYIEKSSDKIVDYAKKLSGENKSAAGQIKNAVKQGFKQAQENLGGLPEAQKILDSVIEKIDSWYYDR
ncbi:MAG: hypothetical protein ACM3UU_01015 [Ignavibacteriales bacterium]